MPFDTEAAKAAGYTDEEINSYLKKSPISKSFDKASAKAAGYSDKEIDSYLAKSSKVGRKVKFGEKVEDPNFEVRELGNLVAEKPQQLLKELPVQAARLAEAPLTIPQSLTNLYSRFATSPKLQRKVEFKQKLPSEHAAEWAREGLAPEQAQASEHLGDLEGFFLPFLLSKLGKGAPSAKPSGQSPPPTGDVLPAQAKAPFKSIFEEPLASDYGAQFTKKAKDVKEALLPSLDRKVPEVLSKEARYSTTKGAQAIEKELGSTYKELTGDVNKAYDLSRELNKSVEGIHPETVDKIGNALLAAKEIPDPSAPVKKLISSLETMDKRLAVRDANGSIVGFKPISNQLLIDQIQEYHKIPTYEFPTDTRNGIFKPLIEDLKEAVSSTAAKNPEAMKAWENAKGLYANREELFGSDATSKWLKRGDKNHSRDWQSSIDLDTIRQMKPALEQSEGGKVVLQQMKRDLAEERLARFNDVQGRFDKKEIAAELRELEEVLSSEEIEQISALFEESQTPAARAASLLPQIYQFLINPKKSLIKGAGLLK